MGLWAAHAVPTDAPASAPQDPPAAVQTPAPAPEDPPATEPAPAQVDSRPSRVLVDTDDGEKEPDKDAGASGSRVITPEPAEDTEDAPKGRVEQAEQSDSANREVVGTRTVTKAPPPPKKAKRQWGTVRRDAAGQVIMPSAPPRFADSVRPEDTDLDGPGRAGVTALQLAAGGVLGAGASLLCGVCALPLGWLVALVISPPLAGTLFAGALFGGCLALWGPFHTVAAAVGVFLPALGFEADPLAAASAAVAVAGLDMLLFVAGGMLATAVILRWAPAPLRTATRAPGVLSAVVAIPDPDGTTVALSATLLMLMGTAVFVAPFAGVAAYTAASYLRARLLQDPAQTPSPQDPEDAASARRRSSRRTRRAP